jgi:hypothetical protein
MSDRIKSRFIPAPQSEEKQMARNYFSKLFAKTASDLDDVMDDDRYNDIVQEKVEELAMWVNKAVSHGGVKKGFTFKE